MAELVAELSNARSQTDKKNLNYSVDEITLELDITCTLAQSADAPNKVKPEFWVLQGDARDAEGELASAQWNMQHLILRLTPRLEDVRAGESEYGGTMSRLPRERPAGLE